MSDVSEHEHEPIHGLPELLPAGEELLWQGAPSWKALARRAFHTQKAGSVLWRAAAVAWHFGVVGKSIGAGSCRRSAMAAATCDRRGRHLGLLAWLISRTTVYTVTSRRVVLRVGVVLSITFNIPYRVIESAGLRVYADGTGDIPLTMIGADRIAYLHFWPHARPWRIARAEPMLRADPGRGASRRDPVAGAGRGSRPARHGRAQRDSVPLGPAVKSPTVESPPSLRRDSVGVARVSDPFTDTAVSARAADRRRHAVGLALAAGSAASALQGSVRAKWTGCAGGHGARVPLRRPAQTAALPSTTRGKTAWWRPLHRVPMDFSEARYADYAANESAKA